MESIFFLIFLFASVSTTSRKWVGASGHQYWQCLPLSRDAVYWAISSLLITWLTIPNLKYERYVSICVL